MTETMTIDALPDGNGAAKRRRARHIPKPRPMSPERLDARLAAAKQFESIVAGIAADLGGEDNLSIMQRELIDAFAGAAISVHDLNARLLLGEKINLAMQVEACRVMVSFASHLGLKRAITQGG
jgi:hypothetical protein